MAMRSLDILFLGILPPQPGGGAISCGQLLDGLAARGHAVRALAPIPAERLLAGDDFAADHPRIALERFVVPYYPIEPTQPPSENIRALEHRQITAALSDMIAARRPDVILIGRGAFVLDVVPIARDWGVPCVLRSAGVTSLGIVDRILPARLVDQLLERYRLVDVIVCPARHLTARLRGAGLRAVQTIPNGIDTRRFHPRPKDRRLLALHQIGADDVVVLHASNLKPFKRPLDLVSAAERVLSTHPASVFVILGDGLLRKALQEAVVERKIADRFRFTGWIDYAHVPAYLSLADLVVMPSEGEGLSRVYLETQASGRVLVASDIPAAREVVVDGQTGLLFKKGESAALADTLEWAIAHPKERTAIARRGRAYVASSHTLEGAVDRYEHLLVGLVRQTTAAAVGIS